MRLYLSAAAAVLLAVGLILGLVARSYRTPEYKAMPWYKPFFVPSWRASEYYTPPGPAFHHLSGSLSSSGALLLIVALFME
jgi:hypothetical protein